MKQEFEMQQSEMDDIIAINKNQPPVMKFGDYWGGMDLQEKINHYWEKLGDKYGFKHLTVEGSSKGKLFFLAEPKLSVVPKTPVELAIEKYLVEGNIKQSLKLIITQLKFCAYESQGGKLENNVAFMALEKLAE